MDKSIQVLSSVSVAICALVAICSHPTKARVSAEIIRPQAYIPVVLRNHTSPTASNTPMPTATNTLTSTATRTPEPTATLTRPPTSTRTRIPTATRLPTATATRTRTSTPTRTPRPTATALPKPAVVIVSSNAFVPFADSKSVYLVGEVRNDTPSNVEFVKINAILRSTSGVIVDGEYTYASISKMSSGMESGFKIIFSDAPQWSTYELTVEWDVADSGPSELPITSSESYFDSSSAFHVRGTVKNTDSQQHTFVQLFVIMYDSTSRVIGVEETFTKPTTLEPSQEVTFDIEVYFWKYKPDKSKISRYTIRAFDD